MSASRANAYTRWLNTQHIEVILYNASVVLIRKMLLDDMNTYAEHCPYGSLSPTILLII